MEETFADYVGSDAKILSGGSGSGDSSSLCAGLSSTPGFMNAADEDDGGMGESETCYYSCFIN